MIHRMIHPTFHSTQSIKQQHQHNACSGYVEHSAQGSLDPNAYVQTDCAERHAEEDRATGTGSVANAILSMFLHYMSVRRTKPQAEYYLPASHNIPIATA